MESSDEKFRPGLPKHSTQWGVGLISPDEIWRLSGRNRPMGRASGRRFSPDAPHRAMQAMSGDALTKRDHSLTYKNIESKLDLFAKTKSISLPATNI